MYMHSFGASAVWFHLHLIFGAAAIIGGLLITVWAVRNLKKDHLKKLAIYAIVIGILGVLITAPMGASHFMMMHGGKRGDDYKPFDGMRIDIAADEEGATTSTDAS